MKLKYDNQDADLNELRRRLFYFGQEAISRFYSPSGIAWFHSSLDYNRLRFVRIAAEINEQNPNPEEREFSLNLGELAVYLGSLKTGLIQLKDMSPAERQDAEMRVVLNLTDRLEKLVKGHIDYSDPDCPSSPNKKPDASWKEWEKKKSLRNWLNIISRVYWEKSESGILRPSI